MTPEQNPNDPQWLDTLAGRGTTDADPAAQQQAEALRRTLKAQSLRIDQSVPKADDRQYQQLLFRLRQEKLAGRQRGAEQAWDWMRSPGQMAARAIAMPSVWGWGLAAAVLLVGLALQTNLLQQGGIKNDDTLVFRGDANTTYIIDEKPAQKLSELIAGLKGIQADFKQEQQSYGKTLLQIKSTDAVLAFFEEKRIVPKVVDGWINIVVSPPSAQKR